MVDLQGQTVFITGASRGIGRAMALKFAKAGANIVIAAKTTDPHPKLPGTIHTVAEEVEALGVEALPVALDVRDENAIAEVVKVAIEKWGRLDVLVNNASAISLTPTLKTPMKRFDLMNSVNARGTFACSQACIPYLRESKNAHIINMSPPMNMDSRWFHSHLAYTMSKYGMSMCTLGLSAELKGEGISVNSLWPQTTIATAAIANHFPQELLEASRKPEIVSDAAYEIVIREPKITGQFCIDEVILRESGVADFKQYACNPAVPLMMDLFLSD